MSKAAQAIIVILTLAVILLSILLYRAKTVQPEPIVIKEQIDSIESKVDSIYHEIDSVDTVIEAIEEKKSDNNRKYEENLTTITNNSVNENLLFFTEYIERNKARLDSINNSRTTEVH